MAATRNGAIQGGMRSIPPAAPAQVRSVHDLRNQAWVHHATGEGNAFQRLERLTQNMDRFQRRLLTLLSQKERMEAQIAQVELERRRILKLLEPRLTNGIQEQQRAFKKPVSLVEVRRA